MSLDELKLSAAALAALCVASASSGSETPVKTVDFEPPAYTADTSIGLYASEGWSAGAGDTSKVLAYESAPSAGNTQYLNLNTAGSTLSNELSNASALNTAIASSDVAYFDYDVKFTPATSLGLKIKTGATKLAFYALASGASTNLVVVTKNGAGEIVHEVTSAPVDCTRSLPVHVEITTREGEMVYSVRAGDAQALSSLAVDAEGEVPGSWFRTINDPENTTIANCNFTGSGTLDNFAYGTRTAVRPEPLAVLIAAGQDDVTYTDLNAALEAGKTFGKTVKLLRNVDLAGVEWSAVADYAGTFDGQGYTIANFSISTAAAAGAGTALIGRTVEGALVKDIVFSNVTVSAANATKVAAVVGDFTGGTMTNITVCGNISIAGNKYVAAIYGWGYGKAVDCHVDGGSAAASTITAITSGEGQVGGIAGFMGEGAVSMQDCSVRNITVAGTERAGGVAGRMHYGSRMIGCSAENVVVKSDSLNEIGALAGTKVGGDPGWVINCSAANVVLKDLDGSDLPYTLLANNFASNGAITAVDAEGLNLYAGSAKYNFTAGTFTLTDAALLSWLEGQVAEEYEAVRQGDSLTYIVRPVSLGPAWPETWTEGRGTEANLAALDAWMKANGLAAADITAALEGNFLMGAPATADVSAGLKISSIAVGDAVVVEVESNVEGVALTAAMPGVVVLKGADDLEGDWTAIAELEVTAGVARFSGTTSFRFFKAFIAYPALQAE